MDSPRTERALLADRGVVVDGDVLVTRTSSRAWLFSSLTESMVPTAMPAMVTREWSRAPWRPSGMRGRRTPRRRRPPCRPPAAPASSAAAQDDQEQADLGSVGDLGHRLARNLPVNGGDAKHHGRGVSRTVLVPGMAADPPGVRRLRLHFPVVATESTANRRFRFK